MFACQNGHAEVVKKMIFHGGDVHAVANNVIYFRFVFGQCSAGSELEICATPYFQPTGGVDPHVNAECVWVME